jgi:hypothetical protein
MSKTRRCLIVERHEWETGAHAHQLQFPLKIANEFFGPGTADRRIHVKVYAPGRKGGPLFERNMTISRVYAPSKTRRTNQLLEMGNIIPPSFVFFQETETTSVYDLWWQTDKAIVAAKFTPWVQGHSGGPGRRGRLAIIVPAPVARPISSIR